MYPLRCRYQRHYTGLILDVSGRSYENVYRYERHHVTGERGEKQSTRDEAEDKRVFRVAWCHPYQ